MTEVYVAKILYAYEGFDILGVYTSYEKAAEALSSLKYKGDGTAITAYIVDFQNESLAL